MCLSAMSHKACPLDAMIIVFHLARGEHDCPKLLVDVLCGHAFLPAMKTRLLFAGDDLIRSSSRRQSAKMGHWAVWSDANFAISVSPFWFSRRDAASSVPP